jgi:hypothetical protein
VGESAGVSVVSATLENFFPQLVGTAYAVTSPATYNYNCIAWAAGVTDGWWWPDPMGVSSWPAGARREETVDAFVEVFQALGFVPAADDTLEPDTEKIALYAIGIVPKHVARQLSNGRWTSKLGPLEDIEHTLDGLVGAWYGSVARILKRPIKP